MIPEQTPRQTRFTAADVAGLRRELADWYGGPTGVQYYHNAIILGQQQIRPPGPPERVARQLAAAEATRLREGDLWYVDEDLCALLNAAHPSMPAFAPRPQDLPSKTGFVVFAEPIAAYAAAEARRDDVVELLATAGGGGDDIRHASDKIYQGQARIVAASWSPVTKPHWPAGGLWMSFYATSAVHVGDILAHDPDAARRARSMMPPLSVDNEAAIAWRPEDAPPDGYQLTGDDDQHGTLTWARLVFATFQLAAQANLAETGQHTSSRAERRRNERAGLPERAVRIIRLRRALTDERDTDPAAAGREWRHRWVVRGHWRNHWYPSLGDHRPLWIAPYLKGPSDAPLLGGDKVTVISAPADPDGSST